MGVLVDDLLELPAIEEFFGIVTQMQRNAGATLGALDLLDFKVTRATADPAHTFRCWQPCTARLHGDLVGHDKARVETHAELTNQLGIALLVAAELFHEGLGATLGNRAQVVDGFLLAHANAGVGNGDGLGVLVERHAHFQIGLVAIEAAVVQGFKAQLVAGVRSVGDQLTQKDLGVGVQRVGHQMQQLRHFGLERMGLLAHVFISCCQK